MIRILNSMSIMNSYGLTINNVDCSSYGHNFPVHYVLTDGSGDLLSAPGHGPSCILVTCSSDVRRRRLLILIGLMGFKLLGTA